MLTLLTAQLLLSARTHDFHCMVVNVAAQQRSKSLVFLLQSSGEQLLQLVRCSRSRQLECIPGRVGCNCVSLPLHAYLRVSHGVLITTAVAQSLPRIVSRRAAASGLEPRIG